MSKKIRFAVIGAGHIGKKHATMIKNNSDAELCAIIDIRPKEDLALEDINVSFFSSLDEFLAGNIKVDVINIATPNGLHASHAIECINNNLHVVIEKPMALKKNDVLKIIDAANEKDRKVFAVMQNRYSPPAKWAKELMDKKILGKIYIVQFSFYWNRDERYYTKDSWHGSKELDGGTLFTQFSHFIDILYWLFGDIENIKSKICDFNHPGLTDFEDSGIITFDFIKGGIGSINFSTSAWDKNMESSMTILAEKGTIKIGGQYMEEVEYCHIKDYKMPKLSLTNQPNNYGHYKGSAANHEYIISNVIDVLKGRGNITTEASEALKVVDIIERIYKES